MLVLILSVLLCLINPQPQIELYGNCRITFYCNCSACCGSWAGSPTASGVMPTAERTAAADLPFGTRLLIDDVQYVVQDRGVSGMCIDIYVDSHEEALNRGMYYTDVYIIKEDEIIEFNYQHY